MAGLNIAKTIISRSFSLSTLPKAGTPCAWVLTGRLFMFDIFLKYIWSIILSVSAYLSSINVRSNNDRFYFSFSVLGGLRASLVSLPVFKTSEESRRTSLSFALSKFITVLSGRPREALRRESKKNEIGKFSLLFVCSKAKGTVPEEVFMKWALARVEIGVKADFGLPIKLSGVRAYLNPSGRSTGWWNSRNSWAGLVQWFGTPINTLAASLLKRVKTSSIAWTKSPPHEWRISCKTLTLIFGKTRIRSSMAEARLCPAKRRGGFSDGSYSVENRRLFSCASPSNAGWLYTWAGSGPTSFESFLFKPAQK